MNEPTACNCILLYTQGALPDRPDFQSWLLSHPLFLIQSKLDFDCLYSLLSDVCSEPILLIELDEPFREMGVYPASAGVFRDLMRGGLDASVA